MRRIVRIVHTALNPGAPDGGKEFEVSAEHIAAKARELMKVKDAALRPRRLADYAFEEALATSH